MDRAEQRSLVPRRERAGCLHDRVDRLVVVALDVEHRRRGGEQERLRRVGQQQRVASAGGRAGEREHARCGASREHLGHEAIDAASRQGRQPIDGRSIAIEHGEDRLFVGRWPDCQRVHPARHLGPRVPDDERRVGAAEREQSPIAQVVAVVRRRREQHDPVGAPREPVDGVVAIGVRRRAVRFVDDDEIPVEVVEADERVAALHEVERHDGRARQRPRAHVGRQCVDGILAAVRVEDASHDADAHEFGRPLLPQVRGHDDQHADGHATCDQLGDRNACLDRLARADRVHDADPRRDPPYEGERGDELVRQEVDRRARDRARHRPRGWRRRERTVEDAVRVGDARRAQPRMSAMPRDAIEGVDQRPRGGVRAIERIEGDRDTRASLSGVRDLPALGAGAYAFAGGKWRLHEIAIPSAA